MEFDENKDVHTTAPPGENKMKCLKFKKKTLRHKKGQNSYRNQQNSVTQTKYWQIQRKMFHIEKYWIGHFFAFQYSLVILFVFFWLLNFAIGPRHIPTKFDENIMAVDLSWKRWMAEVFYFS